MDVFKNCGFRNVVTSTLDVEDRVFLGLLKELKCNIVPSNVQNYI